MKLYNSNLAPSPRRVRIFLAEKGVSIPYVEIDLAKLDHRTPEFSALNPFETIPILELDDGTRIAETIAICRYIEALWPETNLFGVTALEQATIEMWQRQLEWRLLFPIAQVVRHSHPKIRRFPTGRPPIGRGRFTRWRLSMRPCATGGSSPATVSQSPTSRGWWRWISPSPRGSQSRPSSFT
jgi:glutathione S-transferase